MALRGPVGRAWIASAPLGALVCVFALAALLPATPAAAKPKPPVVGGATVTEFTLPERDLFPGSITEGPDGNMWFALELADPGYAVYNAELKHKEEAIVRMTPEGQVTHFPLPNLQFGAYSLVAGPGGDIWFLGVGRGTGGDPRRQVVGRITMAGQVTELPVPGAEGALVVGSDGNLWFARSDSAGEQIVRMTPAGALTEFPIEAGVGVSDLTSGPDGNVWFTEYSAKRIGRITPGGEIAEFPIDETPGVIAPGPDGNLWFTYPYGMRVGRITPTGEIDAFPTAEQPRAMTAGPDGRVWYGAGADAIGRLTPDGRGSEIPLLAHERNLRNLSQGPEGEVWFTAGGQPPCEGGPSTCIATTYSNPGVVGRVSIDPLSAAILRAGTGAHTRQATLNAACRGGEADGICRGKVAVSLAHGGRRLAHHRLALKTDETRTFAFGFGRTGRGRRVSFPKGTRVVATAKVGGVTSRRVLVVH